MKKNSLVLVVLIIFLSACGSGAELSEIVDNPDQAVAQGSRILGLDVKGTPSVTYEMAYNQAINMGVRQVKVSLNWSILEPNVGVYANHIPDIIEAFYPVQRALFTLVLRPLDTPGPSLPTELAGLAYDHPDVISAFGNFLTNLHARLPNLNASGRFKSIQVGNEIDSYLGTDALKWSQWQTFFKAAKVKINSLWGSNIAVSSIIQFSALSDAGKLPLYLNLLPELDSAVINYYPLNADFTMRPPSTVATDFDFMVAVIPSKSIVLQECGYPSSPINNSSEVLQADFITSVFKAWDTHIARISLIDFTWQYDVSEEQLDTWVVEYGVSGQPGEDTFRAYLATLGFSNFDSSEKLALQRLREELHVRQWQQ